MPQVFWIPIRQFILTFHLGSPTPSTCSFCDKVTPSFMIVPPLSPKPLCHWSTLKIAFCDACDQREFYPILHLLLSPLKYAMLPMPPSQQVWESYFGVRCLQSTLLLKAQIRSESKPFYLRLSVLCTSSASLLPSCFISQDCDVQWWVRLMHLTSCFSSMFSGSKKAFFVFLFCLEGTSLTG